MVVAFVRSTLHLGDIHLKVEHFIRINCLVADFYFFFYLIFAYINIQNIYYTSTLVHVVLMLVLINKRVGIIGMHVPNYMEGTKLVKKIVYFKYVNLGNKINKVLVSPGKRVI